MGMRFRRPFRPAARLRDPFHGFRVARLPAVAAPPVATPHRPFRATANSPGGKPGVGVPPAPWNRAPQERVNLPPRWGCKTDAWRSRAHGSRRGLFSCRPSGAAAVGSRLAARGLWLMARGSRLVAFPASLRHCVTWCGANVPRSVGRAPLVRGHARASPWQAAWGSPIAPAAYTKPSIRG